NTILPTLVWPTFSQPPPVSLRPHLSSRRIQLEQSRLGPAIHPKNSLKRSKHVKRLQREGLRRLTGGCLRQWHGPCFLQSATRNKSTRTPGSAEHRLVNQPSTTNCFSKGDNHGAATLPARSRPLRPHAGNARRP